MSVVIDPDRPWDAPDYSRIVGAWYEAGLLTVRFGDSTEARIDVSRMTRVEAREPDWPALTFDDFEVVVPTREGPFEIPWLPLRSLADPAFRAYLDAEATRSARRLGRRVRTLREDQGLSLSAIAERTSIGVATLARIEQGDLEIHLPALQRILDALGHDVTE